MGSRELNQLIAPAVLGINPNEEIISERLRIQSGPRPVFGDKQVWDLISLGLPPSENRSLARVNFSSFKGPWNLTARLLVFSLVQPDHQVFRDAGIFRSAKSAKIKTISGYISGLRSIAQWALDSGISSDLAKWGEKDIRALLSYMGERSNYKEKLTLRVLKRILEDRELINPGFQVELPKVPHSSRIDLKTEPLGPQDFWALIRATWLYIDTFSEDIYGVREYLDDLYENDREKGLPLGAKKFTLLLKKWLKDSKTKIPVQTHLGERTINWNGLARMISPNSNDVLNKKVQRDLVFKSLNEGKDVMYGVYPGTLKKTRNNAGEEVSWTEGFGKLELNVEISRLKTAVYIFIACNTTMRTSEMLSIPYDCKGFVDGAPVIKSRIYKHRRPGGDPATWWIIPPVERAIDVGQALHGPRDFLLKNDSGQKFDIIKRMNEFVSHVNKNAEAWGINQIKTTHITPHRLRRTMAVVTANEPLGEIANGFTLGHHLSRAGINGLTQAYGAPTGEWIELFETEYDKRKAVTLAHDWELKQKGALTVSSPGAKNYEALLDRLPIQATPVTRIDERAIRNLLRDDFSTFRLGTLNHCLGNVDQAECLVGLNNLSGESQPISARCHPDSCRNSVVTAEHLHLWQSEKNELERLLKDRRMAPTHAERVKRQLESINRLLGQNREKRVSTHEN